MAAALVPAACTSSSSSRDGAIGGELGAPGIDLRAAVDALGDGAPGGDLAATCMPRHDGVLSRDELPTAIGAGERFRISPGGATVVTASVDGAWDYGGALPGDQEVADPLLPTAGAWWSGDFPRASFARRSSDQPPLLGVYQATDDGLLLLGVVSEQPGVAQTSLFYATPLRVLRLPLAEGDRWTSEADITGLLSGVIFAAHHRYDFVVDGRHATSVPAGDYDTLRLRADRTERSGVRTTTRIEYQHLAECAGTVATLRSRDNEPRADFTDAADYRRRTTP